jgi:hypothetical protein
MNPTYRRKLSRGEVSEGSILIEKTKWRLFPRPGEPLRIEVSGASIVTAIEAEDCNCVPPPHQHYHLPAAALQSHIEFRPGVVLTFERLGEGHYRLS